MPPPPPVVASKGGFFPGLLPAHVNVAVRGTAFPLCVCVFSHSAHVNVAVRDNALKKAAFPLCVSVCVCVFPLPLFARRHCLSLRSLIDSP